MRKALVLMMTTCILFAGCIEGLTEDVEEVVEELAPGCNDPTAINYDENDTTATTCITEDVLFESIGEFTEKSENGNQEASGVALSGGIIMTISGVDEEMGMGAYTMVSKTAANENTAYSGTDITVSGMTISQSWTIQESGDGTILQASYMGESFLMYSAMSWDDVSDDCDDSDDRDCVDAEISQEDCERRGGTWTEVTDRPIDGYCNFEDDGDRGDDDSEMTQEDCEERGGNWTEAPDREGQFYCDFGEEDRDDERDDSDREEDREITQEDCEDRGGNWTQDDSGDYHCEFDDEDRASDDGRRCVGDDECSATQICVDGVCRDGTTIVWPDYRMNMDIPDPMDFLSMKNGDCDDTHAAVNPDACRFPENTGFDVGTDGIVVTIPVEENQSMEMMFDLVTGEMTGLSMDMDDGSHMKLEMLTEEEVTAMLTIDTTLEYEALPFTVECCGETYWRQMRDNGSVAPVTSDGDFDFAGAFDDYSVVLANCVEETDDMGETTLTCDESKSTMYAIPGIIPGSNEDMDSFAEIVAFMDTDSSGTLTDGDEIWVGDNVSVNWTHVRLHSTSADAYSDENPMLTPGFTTILGALSLMGAAMIGRRD